MTVWRARGLCVVLDSDVHLKFSFDVYGSVLLLMVSMPLGGGGLDASSAADVPGGGSFL